MPQDTLTPAEFERYQRQLQLDDVGIAGQLKLKQARVLCVGSGGLGCPALLYLAAAGVGHLGVIDGDTVERSNLHRQVLFTETELGQNKAQAAVDKLRLINPTIALKAYPFRLDHENAHDIIAQYDLLIDGSDNFSTRYLINDVCCTQQTPNVHASIHQFSGHLCVFTGQKTDPCYRCLFPEAPTEHCALPNCSEAGVLGVLPGILGVLQATEALKWILDPKRPHTSQLITFNAFSLEMKMTQLTPDEHCPHTQTDFKPNRDRKAPHCPDEQASHSPKRIAEISVTDLQQMLKNNPRDTLLLDVRKDDERQQGHIGGVHIPLAELPQRHHELDPSQPLVVYCRSGGRSLKAAQFLADNHYKSVTNLKGGLLAWAATIDPTVLPG